ncbi:membrane transporter [Theileria orientalis]|uniref:Membrane transporter n=1 Tax=Theileria orientalis TaxID=68886 RepID=A0A976MDQ1_THEOR|nr:membrane transporter [Theileria orientalis]
MEGISDTPTPTSTGFRAENPLIGSEPSMNRSILSASLIYMILSYLNTFGNVGMYLVSYMRVSGNKPNTSFSSVSCIFSLAVLLQSLSGLFTGTVEKSLGTRKITILGCSITAMAHIACAFNLHSLSSLIFFYSVVAGVASGLILPIPLDAAVRTNPSKRGYICGSVYFYGGILTVLLCPLQTFYINKGDVRLGDIVKPSDNDIYYKDVKLLNRLPKLFILQGLLYLLVLAICVYYLDFPKDREPAPDYTEEPEIEYETFITKRLNNTNDFKSNYKKDYKKYLYLWFLIYLSWQSIIYLQSYWKIVALLKLDGSDLFITFIGAAASASNILGRIFWGIIFDMIGWKISWIILVSGTLLLTVSSYFLFEYNLTVYGIWITSVFFIHSGVFSIGPMTAHQFFGPNKFIMSVGFLNTARAASGLTALIYANFNFSRWNDHLPITVSLICLASLLIIWLFNTGKNKKG